MHTFTKKGIILHIQDGLQGCIQDFLKGVTKWGFECFIRIVWDTADCSIRVFRSSYRVSLSWTHSPCMYLCCQTQYSWLFELVSYLDKSQDDNLWLLLWQAKILGVSGTPENSPKYAPGLSMLYYPSIKIWPNFGKSPLWVCLK